MNEWKKTSKISLIIFVVVMTYAVIRYNIYKGTSIESIPLFILNKAISLSSVVLIGLSFLLGSLARFWSNLFVSRLYLRKPLGILGFALAAIHTLISLLLFNPAYYPKFFTGTGQLNLTGELSMLFGVLALAIFSTVALISIPQVADSMDAKQWLFVQRTGYLAFILVGLHVGVMGFEGWLKPTTWPGGLLPISLIAFTMILFVLLARLIVAIFPKKQNH